MRSTLFHIPPEVFGLPLLGVGLLLAVWTAVCVGRIAWVVARRGWSSEVWAEVPMMVVMAVVIGWVLPNLAEPEGLPIRGYGVMVFLGVVAGVALAVHRARQAGYSAESIYSLAVVMCISGIVGGRLFYVIEYWSEFRKPTLGATLLGIVKYTEGGLVVYGAFVGGAIAAVIFFVRHKLPVLKFADLIVPSLTLGLALGRLGCFLNGCCFGGKCDLPWAVSFPTGSPPYMSQVERGQLSPPHGIYFQQLADGTAVIEKIDADSPAAASGLQPGDRLLSITVEAPGKKPRKIPAEKTDPRLPLPTNSAVAALAMIEQQGTRADFEVITADRRRAMRTWVLAQPAPLTRSLPVHPAQLYSAIDALLITLILLAWHPFRRHDGEVTALLLTIYPITRFLEEIIRTDESAVFGTGLSISQNVSILILAAAVVLWIYVLRSPRLRVGSTTTTPHDTIVRE